MNTSPLNFHSPHVGVTRSNLQNGMPPGSAGGVGPQDTVTSGEFAAPPVIHVPPASNEGSEKRRVPRWALGLLGLTAALGVGMATLGPMAAGTHEATAPVAAVTVHQEARETKADLKTEVQKAQYGIALQDARFNTTPSATSFGPSADYVELRNDRMSTEANGFTFTYEGAQLIARGGTEDVKVYDAREGLMPEYLDAFANEGNENWHVKTSVRPAGGAATLASIAVTSDVYTGGSPNQTAELMTFDHVEGQRVLLSSLLSQGQQSHVLNSIRGQLASVPAGSLFDHGDGLAEIVDRSFAVRDEGGKDLKLMVAVPGNSEANEGKVAEFTFSVPRDILK